ncbi:hypothetical protein [Flavitalea sp.]|nr:hypothetical protein [Flavitalea sp.]
MNIIDIHEGDNGITFFSLMVDGSEAGLMMFNKHPELYGDIRGN